MAPACREPTHHATSPPDKGGASARRADNEQRTGRDFSDLDADLSPLGGEVAGGEASAPISEAAGCYGSRLGDRAAGRSPKAAVGRRPAPPLLREHATEAAVARSTPCTQGSDREERVRASAQAHGAGAPLLALRAKLIIPTIDDGDPTRPMYRPSARDACRLACEPADASRNDSRRKLATSALGQRSRAWPKPVRPHRPPPSAGRKCRPKFRRRLV